MNLTINKPHEYYMNLALKQAQKAALSGDVPVGALVVREGKIIARARNTREKAHDPAGHAEVNALRKAAKKLGGWNLHGCVLYVTLEPCAMCAGAAVNARIAHIVFGAPDAKAGACGSRLQLCAKETGLNHCPQVTGGVLAQLCAGELKAFFAARRKRIDKPDLPVL